MKRKLQASGKERFDIFYEEIFKERWQGLKTALLQPNLHAARINTFAASHVEDITEILCQQVPSVFSGQPKCTNSTYFPTFLVPHLEANLQTQAFAQPQLSKLNNCLKPYYLMDLASIITATMLDVQPGDRVCDFCAAPGGKTLILAEALQGTGSLVANDSSKNRMYALRRNLHDYLPENVRSLVSTRNFDATRWPQHENGTYDKILVDAPCSSERHLLSLGYELHLQQWSPLKTKFAASRQKALLWSAAQALKEGGQLLYSTCALSPAENDGTVLKTLKKNKGLLEVLPESCINQALIKNMLTHLPGIEKTELGWLILPDRCSGWGPMYFSIFRKVRIL